MIRGWELFGMLTPAMMYRRKHLRRMILILKIGLEIRNKEYENCEEYAGDSNRDELRGDDQEAER